MIKNKHLGIIVTILSIISDFVMLLPFSFVLIVLTIFDNEKWPLIIIAVLVDIFINLIGFVIEKKANLDILTNKIVNFIPDEIEFIENSFTRKIIDILRIAYKGKKKGLLKNIKVIRSNLEMKFTTSTSFNDLVLILVKKNFNENEFIDQVLLAHEFAHAPHCQLRAIKYNTSVFAIISAIVVIISTFLGVNWWICAMLLIINILILTIHPLQEKTKEEVNADTLALQIIESIYDSDKMHKAAYILLIKRIKILVHIYEEKITKGDQYIDLEYLIYKEFVYSLANFVTKEHKEKLISQSQQRTYKNSKNKLMTFAEKDIQNILHNSDFLPTSFGLKMDVNKCFPFVLLSYVGTVFCCITAFSPLNFIGSDLTFLLAIVIVISYIFIYFKYYFIWKNRSHVFYQKKILQ